MKSYAKITSTLAVGAFFLVALTGCPPQDEPTPQTNGEETGEWREDVGPAVEDATITARILSRLAADRDVSVFDISVSTDAGVVTLEGSVATDEQRLHAEAVAQETSGVIRVDNRIVIEPVEIDVDREPATEPDTDTEY